MLATLTGTAEEETDESVMAQIPDEAVVEVKPRRIQTANPRMRFTAVEKPLPKPAEKPSFKPKPLREPSPKANVRSVPLKPANGNGKENGLPSAMKNLKIANAQPPQSKLLKKTKI